jgi:hypothetical protein
MSDDGERRLEDRIEVFLRQHAGREVCEECLAAELSCRPDEIAGPTSRLARLPDFLQDSWRCRRCRRWTRVIRALRTTTAVAQTEDDAL